MRGDRRTHYRVGPGEPYTRLQDVVSLLNPGDVVEVDGNATYAGGVTFVQPGTAQDPIVIRGVKVDGKRPILSGGTNTVHFRTDVIGTGADHYVFEGFEVTGGSSRCIFHQSDDLTLRDLVVRNCPSHGLLGADFGSGSLTLEHSEFYGSGSGTTRHQIYMAIDEDHYPDGVFRMWFNWVHDGAGGNNVKCRAARNEIYYSRSRAPISTSSSSSASIPHAAPRASSAKTRMWSGTSSSRNRRPTDRTPISSRCASVATAPSRPGSLSLRQQHLRDGENRGLPHLRRAAKHRDAQQRLLPVRGIAGADHPHGRGEVGQWTADVGVEQLDDDRLDASTRRMDGDADRCQPRFRRRHCRRLFAGGWEPLVDAGSGNPTSAEEFPFPGPLFPPALHPPGPPSVFVVRFPNPRPVNGASDIGAYERNAPGLPKLTIGDASRAAPTH